MRLSTAVPLALALSSAGAFELPFEIPFQVPFFKPNTSAKSSTSIVNETASTAHRVAVIGAGAGGSSAAFWLGLARLRHGHDIEIDVYDKQGYVGGRAYHPSHRVSAAPNFCIGSTTVYPYENTSLPVAELGASIFVKANKNLWRATDEFNLTRLDFAKDETLNDDTGIWDGEKFVYIIRGGGRFSGWLESAKLLWRYGWMSVMRTRNMCVTTQFYLSTCSNACIIQRQYYSRYLCGAVQEGPSAVDRD